MCIIIKQCVDHVIDQLKPQISQIILAVTNGIGVMPAFEGMLTSEEIEAVAYFVSTSSNK